MSVLAITETIWVQIEILVFDFIIWNELTVCKQMRVSSFKK